MEARPWLSMLTLIYCFIKHAMITDTVCVFCGGGGDVVSRGVKGFTGGLGWARDDHACSTAHRSNALMLSTFWCLLSAMS